MLCSAQPGEGRWCGKLIYITLRAHMQPIYWQRQDNLLKIYCLLSWVEALRKYSYSVYSVVFCLCDWRRLPDGKFRPSVNDFTCSTTKMAGWLQKALAPILSHSYMFTHERLIPYICFTTHNMCQHLKVIILNNIIWWSIRIMKYQSSHKLGMCLFDWHSWPPVIKELHPPRTSPTAPPFYPNMVSSGFKNSKVTMSQRVATWLFQIPLIESAVCIVVYSVLPCFFTFIQQLRCWPEYRDCR